jgi:hypothetical protein
VVIRKANGESQERDTGKLISVVTINRELVTLRRMLNMAVKWRLLKTAPQTRLLPGEEERQRVISFDEEEVYLTLARQPLRDFAIVSLDTAFRPGEIQRMRWENVHLNPVSEAQFGYIHNPGGGPKKRKRNLSMTPRVHDTLHTRWVAAW